MKVGGFKSGHCLSWAWIFRLCSIHFSFDWTTYGEFHLGLKFCSRTRMASILKNEACECERFAVFDILHALQTLFYAAYVWRISCHEVVWRLNHFQTHTLCTAVVSRFLFVVAVAESVSVIQEIYNSHFLLCNERDVLRPFFFLFPAHSLPYRQPSHWFSHTCFFSFSVSIVTILSWLGMLNGLKLASNSIDKSWQ